MLIKPFVGENLGNSSHHVAKTQTVVEAGAGTGFMAAGLAPFARQVSGADFSDAIK